MTMLTFVHVIDDDDGVREALAALLESSGLSVRTYPAATAFLDELDTAQPGCVISDVRMPGLTGIELLQKLQDRREDFPMILLTGAAEVPMAVAALKSGALDFIEKPFGNDQIIAAAHGALEGMRAQNARAQDRSESARRLADLTPRERQVLEQLVAGASSKAAARALGISPRTVDVYRANIMAKTRAESLAELVRVVIAAEAGTT